MSTTLKCSKCKAVKPASDFRWRRDRPHKRRATCKECERAAVKKWLAKPKNRARAAASVKAWFGENRAYAKAYRDHYYRTHKPMFRKSGRAKQARSRAQMWDTYIHDLLNDKLPVRRRFPAVVVKAKRVQLIASRFFRHRPEHNTLALRVSLKIGNSK